MTLERAKITKNAGNVGAASHDALEERDHPHTGRVGEELLDVEAVNDAVTAMARGIADVASSLHRAEQKRWLCCKDWWQSEVGCRSAPIRRLLRTGDRMSIRRNTSHSCAPSMTSSACHKKDRK